MYASCMTAVTLTLTLTYTTPRDATLPPRKVISNSTRAWFLLTCFPHGFGYRARMDHYCVSVSAIVACISPIVRQPRGAVL